MTSNHPIRPTTYCETCGAGLKRGAAACTQCGTIQSTALLAVESDKRIMPALALCVLFGVFGAHRFYVGKVGTGILQLLTLGGLGLWMMIDMVLIIVGAFRDGDGDRITEWI